MPTQIHRHPCESPLRMRRPKHPRSTERTKAAFRMIGHEEFIAGLCLETLLPAPRHVLNHHQSTISNEDIIQHAMPDNSAIQTLNNRGQHTKARRRGIIRVVNKHIRAGTFRPFYGWGIDSSLHVRAIEVDRGAVGEIVEGAGEAEDVPEERAGGRYLVDVEAGV